MTVTNKTTSLLNKYHSCHLDFEHKFNSDEKRCIIASCNKHCNSSMDKIIQQSEPKQQMLNDRKIFYREGKRRENEKESKSKETQKENTDSFCTTDVPFLFTFDNHKVCLNKYSMRLLQVMGLTIHSLVCGSINARNICLICSDK